MKLGDSPADTLLEDPAGREEGSARNTVEKISKTITPTLRVPTYS